MDLSNPAQLDEFCLYLLRWLDVPIIVSIKLEQIAVANIKSAIKRVEIAERNRLRNKSYKSAIKTLTKKYLVAVEEYAANPSDDAKQVVRQHMSAAYSRIDKAVKRGVIHVNNGANKKARIARAFRKYVEPFTPSET